MPWAASFAFNNVERAARPARPAHQRLQGSAPSGSNPKGMVRVDYWGSYFNNDIQTLTWDNPIRATDFNNGLAPPNGRTTPAATATATGRRMGQAALWPSNNAELVRRHRDVQGAAARPRSTATCSSPTCGRTSRCCRGRPTARSTTRRCWPAFPGLRGAAAQLGRGGVDGLNALVNFNSRPVRVPDAAGALPLQQARQRDAAVRRHARYVRFDAVPEEFADDPATEHVEGFSSTSTSPARTSTPTPPSSLHKFGSFRARLRATRSSTARAAASANVAENTLRLSYDATARSSRHPVRATLDYGAAPRRRLHPRAASTTKTGVGGDAARPALLRRGRPQPHQGRR